MEEIMDSHTPQEARSSLQQEEHLKNVRQRRARELEQGFWLTEAQKIFIQHKLPKLYCLVAMPHNSRLLNSSKLLEEESIQFTKNKRGRPEGSRKSNLQSPAKSRKSLRVSNEVSSRPKQAQESKNEPSEQNEELFSISCAKDLEFSPTNAKPKAYLASYKQLQLRNAAQEKSQQKSSSKAKAEQGRKQYASKFTDQFSRQSDQKKSKASKKKQTRGKQQQHPNQTIEQYSNVSSKAQQKAKSIIQKLSPNLANTTQKQYPLFPAVRQQAEASPELQQMDPKARLQQMGSKAELQQMEQKESLQLNRAKRVADKQEEEIESKATQLKFSAQLQILAKLKQHARIGPFLQPVDEEKDGAPDYYSTIADPIDIQTIEFKLTNNIYKQPSEFHADLTRMWSNARLYNNSSFMRRTIHILEKEYFRLAKLLPSSQRSSKDASKKARKPTSQ